MSYPAYPGGYVYYNELVQGADYGVIVWLPIIAVYMTLIAIASGSTIALAASILTGNRTLLRIAPILFAVSLSTSLVFLLGPLADLRRPDRFYMILLSPHILPSSTHPGVSVIALIATILWPLLIILLVITGLSAGLTARFKVSMSPLTLKILAFILLLVAIAWSMYPSLLLFTTTPIPAFINYMPLLPIETLLESVVVGVSLASIPIILHRVNVEKDDLKLLTSIILLASGFFVILRLLGILRLRVHLAGGEEVRTLVEALEPLNTIVLLAGLVVFVLGLAGLRRPSSQVLAMVSLVAVAWVLLDRWMLVVNTQAVSRTGLAILPLEVTLGAWVLESIALVLLSMGVYTILTWLIVPVKVTGGEGR